MSPLCQLPYMLQRHWLLCPLFQSQAFNKIDEIYHERLFRRSQWALYEDQNERFEGKILGVNEQGLLEIEKEFTVESYDLKEISFIFPL